MAVAGVPCVDWCDCSDHMLPMAQPKRVDAAADKPDGQGSVWNANNYHWYT